MLDAGYLVGEGAWLFAGLAALVVRAAEFGEVPGLGGGEGFVGAEVALLQADDGVGDLRGHDVGGARRGLEWGGVEAVGAVALERRVEPVCA
ncbi:hypothetical protein AB0H51_05455 [Streptomyces griseoluteus]|uniref:hypothetical protein n=1 Tax=Streptomyces griseoluteus TaxID=29306 RepID=UPI0033C835C4